MRKFPKRMIGLSRVTLVAFLAVGCSQPITPPVERTSDLSRSNAFLPTTMNRALNFDVYGGREGITNRGLYTKILGDDATIGASTMFTGFHRFFFIDTEIPH